MKIFIGCSSSNDISCEYKVVSKFLAENISKNNDLIFGAVNRGLMGIFYSEFLKNKRKISGICYEVYKDELSELVLDEVFIVNSLEESTKKLEEESDLILFLPGSYGTLSEFIYILESKRIGLHDKDIAIFNINGFYDEQIEMFNKMYNKISKSYDFNKLCKVFTTVDDVVNFINIKRGI